MAYNDKEIGNIELYCPACAKAKVGTKLDDLYYGLTSDPVVQYSGNLLTDEEVALLNNMCGAAKEIELGTIINGILSASKNGTEAEEIEDEVAAIIDNGICGLFSASKMGTKLQEMVEIINNQPVPPTPSTEANVLTYKIGEAAGTVNAETGAIAVEVPHGTTVTALVAEFTLSENATAKVGSVAQVSGTTENDFTNPVVYVVTAEDGTTTKNWTVTVTVAAE